MFFAVSHYFMFLKTIWAGPFKKEKTLIRVPIFSRNTFFDISYNNPENNLLFLIKRSMTIMTITALITILLLSLSSSIDNFGVGISYGIRNIRIGFLANFIIAIIAFVFSEMGILFGQYISKVFPGTLSDVIGTLFLFVIGLRIILMTIPRKRKFIKKCLMKRNLFRMLSRDI